MMQQPWSVVLALLAALWLAAITGQWQVFFWQVVPFLATALEAQGAVLHPALESAINLYLVSRWPFVIVAIITVGLSLSSSRWARPLMWTVLSTAALLQLLSAVVFLSGSVQVVEVSRALLSSP